MGGKSSDTQMNTEAPLAHFSSYLPLSSYPLKDASRRDRNDGIKIFGGGPQGGREI